jgi:opacity protein-like surface antigen
VSGDAVFPLGIPLKVTMTPLDVVAGWRSAPAGRIVTYGGAGFTSMAYTETSDFADTGENVDERYKGWVVLGGVEVRAAAWVHVRGEVRYRQVPNVLGSGGVSAAYDETKLGGVGVALKVAFGR